MAAPAAGEADEAVAARAAAGEEAAFETLVSRYQARLYRLACRLTGDPGEAQDVLQEGFLAAYRSLATFRGEARFSTWLYRIAFNLAMSHGRKRRPLTIMDTDDTTRNIEPVSTEHSPSEPLEAAVRVAGVQAAIQDLADEHRQVVVLRELEGCDYEQIADILEIPIGTVRSRLFRARACLKSSMRGWMAG